MWSDFIQMEVVSILQRSTQNTWYQTDAKGKNHALPTALICSYQNVWMAQYQSVYDKCWMMLEFQTYTAHQQSLVVYHKNSTLIQLVFAKTTQKACHERKPSLQHLSVFRSFGYVCFLNVKQRNLIMEKLEATLLGTAYWLDSSSCINLWTRHCHPSEMWYSGNENYTQHRMLQLKWCWRSTSIMMPSCNLHPPRSNLKSDRQSRGWYREMNVLNTKQMHHCIRNHLQSARRSHENWLALGCHLGMHGIHWLKVVAESTLTRICCQSLQGWNLKIRNLRINNLKRGFPSVRQLQSLTIRTMRSMVQSHTNE